MLQELKGLFQLATVGGDMGRLTHEFEMQEDGVRTWRDLIHFLQIEPQRDANGFIRYLITSGWAVELATGVARQHGDLDIILMNGRDRREKDRVSGTYGIDSLTAKTNWGGMESSNIFLLTHAIPTSVTNKLQALVVHPATILAQKLGHYEPRLRDQDLADIETILSYASQMPPATRERFSNVFYETLLRMPAVSSLQVQDRLQAMRGQIILH